MKSSSYTPKNTAGNGCPRLLIDEKYDIWLEQNGRKTAVSMTPLCKALYLFFLQNPQGVTLYELQNHQQQLLEIYKKISCKHDYNCMQDHIGRLVHKLDNSVHEKISRIKGIFNNLLAQEFAQWFYIKGRRRHEKGIALPRNMVISMGSF